MSGISTVPMYGDRLDFSVPTLGFPYEELERLQGLVSTAVLAKRGKYGESNLYESLAEMDKTFGTLKDIFDRARRIQNTIFYGRKGSSRPRKLTEEVAGQYLATRYGFAPLIKDLEGIIAGLEKRLGQRLMTTRATERWSSVTNTTLPPHTDAGTIDFLRSSRVEQNLTVQAFSLDNVKLDVWGALGLGWKDLLSVPWELKSHSFVVDWFLNVGDLFGALLPDIGFSNVGQGLVINWTRVDTTTYTGAVLNPGKVSSMDLLSSQTPPPQTRTITYKQRTVLPLKASLRWKSDFRFDKLTRMLDSVALFTQQASKIRDSGQMSELDDLIKHRRRNPSRKGVRKAADYQNLSDR
jgi:hypothetical protein